MTIKFIDKNRIQFKKSIENNIITYIIKYTAQCGHKIIIQRPKDITESYIIDWDKNYPVPCPKCSPGFITLNGQPLPDSWYSVEGL